MRSKKGAYAYAVAIIVLFVVILLIVYVFPEVGDFITNLFGSGNNVETVPANVTP
ncbi:MAG: hypothetical protein KKF65_02740 [Nanoarchaeota archaeon]|nr:hypothetical protein [Nanoarchaeota archaeon]